MSKHLEKDVNQVRNRILDLGEMVAESIETASAMIQNYDLVLVNQVYEVEHLIDKIEVEIEEECLKVLALHQPVSENLRFLIVILKVNNDLERMGDQLKNIAERIEYISDKDSGISPDAIGRLIPAWSVGFTNSNRMRSQPTLAGGYLFVGTHNGGVYALDQEFGCMIWHFNAAGEVRTGISIDPWDPENSDADPQIYFGDVLGNVYAVKARTGDLVWRDKADDHANATITGAPSLHNGVLYTPVSSLEL